MIGPMLVLGALLLGLGFICYQPKWYQILFQRRYFCSRCSALIAKAEALEEARYEPRPPT